MLLYVLVAVQTVSIRDAGYKCACFKYFEYRLKEVTVTTLGMRGTSACFKYFEYRLKEGVLFFEERYTLLLSRVPRPSVSG